MITDKFAKPSGMVPFILRTVRLRIPADAMPGRDMPATEEPLPAALEINKVSGDALARQTRRTYVERETTDDD